jgi:hypothetical protein
MGHSTTNAAHARFSAVCQQIYDACREAGREQDAVRLIAVSKARPAADIAALAALGQRDFAESYLQEALEKIDSLRHNSLIWHFIGPIQSNKSKDIATHFDWAHSVDRDKIAQRLNDQRPADLAPLNVCIQVNIDAEQSKSGVTLEQVPALAQSIAALPRLRLRGLMAIPKADSADRGRSAFQRLAMTLTTLSHTMPGLDTLSMGMSDDFDVAIMAGATHVRVGTALFGPRASKP